MLRERSRECVVFEIQCIGQGSLRARVVESSARESAVTS